MASYPPLSAATIAWLHTVIDVNVAAMDPLVGGIASTVVAVRDTNDREFVLRLWTRPDWQRTDPHHGPHNEMAALAALADSGLPVPELIAADPTGAHCAFPALLMTRLPGKILSSATHIEPASEPITDDVLRQLAAAADVLHNLAIPDIGPYEPYVDLRDWRPPTTNPVWAQAIEIVAAEPPREPDVFIHRDYHPGNTLWSDGRLAGIIDWTTAARGPAGVDFAHLRINLVIAYDQATADSLLRFIPEHNPYWDLRAAIDMSFDETDDLPRIEEYLTSVLHRIVPPA